MACRVFKALLPAYADGALPPQHERLVNDHLPGCDSCRRTVRLLGLENRSIRSALRGGARLGERRSSRTRFVRVSLAAGILLGVFLVSLHGAYRGVAARARAAAAGDPLARAVLVRRERTPLPAFIAELSRRSGVAVELSEAAKRRLSPPPEVTVVLYRPIRLGSLLALLGEFYGLTPRVESDRVVLD